MAVLEALVSLTSWLLLGVGSSFVLIGGIGALRMPTLYTRIHAASLTDSLGPILVLGGLMLHAGISLETFKLAAILLFMLLTGPTATYALGNAALLAGMKPPADEREEH
ncbi:MAG: monovalent cation/H(+) antiporter subunit G [Pseudomonadales bacterium]